MAKKTVLPEEELTEFDPLQLLHYTNLSYESYANILGSSYRSLYDWSKGKTQPGTSFRRLAAELRRRWQQNPPEFVIKSLHEPQPCKRF